MQGYISDPENRRSIGNAITPPALAIRSMA
jgi:hypothetical protein